MESMNPVSNVITLGIIIYNTIFYSLAILVLMALLLIVSLVYLKVIEKKMKILGNVFVQLDFMMMDKTLHAFLAIKLGLLNIK